MSLIRTDLAVEAREIASGAGALDGVVSEDTQHGNVSVSKVEVTNENGARAIGKPIGTYVTVEVPSLGDAEDDNFYNALDIIAVEIQTMLQPAGQGEVLVAGLGNATMTPDAIGPDCIKSIFVTRHVMGELTKLAGFEQLRPVAAVSPGVLGQTGVEVGEILKALVAKIHPVAVIVVDALASRRASRLGNTVQISNTGIIPGSGVGNSRFAVNQETLGVPVIALGVPTVVDASTLVVDLLEGAGVSTDRACQEKINAYVGRNPMFVTPRFIDTIVEHASRLVGLAINRALNPSISLEDMTALIS